MAEQTYFESRLAQLGITPELNSVELKHSATVEENGIKSSGMQLQPVPIFREHQKGIEIICYSIDRDYHTYKPENSRFTKNWSIIRLENPIVRQNGDQMKYQMPKGQGSYPFFPPSLLNKYDNREKIDVLFLVEGYFKAFKAAMHGADIVGLPSITHLKNKETGALHPDIVKLMHRCGIRRVVYLVDGDCFDISRKALDPKEKVDLYRRPYSFFSSVATFKQLLDDYDVEKYFFHVDTDGILLQKYFMRDLEQQAKREDLKGLDDVMVTLPGSIPEIIQDMQEVSKKSEWFGKYNITIAITKVWREFRLNDVVEFYLFHSERNKELKGKEFVFNGTRFKYNEEKGVCDIVVPGEASEYFRVGDDYYRFINKPNKYKKPERVFQGRRKSTITDDHGKNFCNYIPKYHDFCNVPDHVNHQPVVENCFNVYQPLDYTPLEEDVTEEDCASIIGFLKHIFGESLVSFTHPKTKEKKEYRVVDLALDYIQLLYQRPTEKLPILCLVSRENNTGKSTFGKLLRQIFGANCAVVGNQDIAGDFNAHWSTKLVVVCDESKIDKQIVIEKMKSLSTADKIMINAKGKDHKEIDCFLKFILITNHEENFINITEDDIRYWIIKVPVIREENPSLMDNMVEEISAFLAYLNKRKLMTERLNRMWFHPSLLKTDALKKVQRYSLPTIQKELHIKIRDMFFDFGEKQILMTRSAIHKELLNGKLEVNYLEKTLKESMRIDQYWEPHPTEKDIYSEPVKVYKLKRHSYPKWYWDATKNENVRIEVSDNGRPYVLNIEDFLTAEEIATLEVSPENKFINGMTNAETIAAGNSEELPFA
jgi:hypothetical protein